MLFNTSAICSVNKVLFFTLLEAICDFGTVYCITNTAEHDNAAIIAFNEDILLVNKAD